MRSLLADAELDIDDLIHPLLLTRAGLPLDSAQRGRFEGMLERLKSFIPEPEHQDDVDHSLKLAKRSRDQKLLQLKGGFTT